MKQKDILTIVVIAIIAGIFSLVLTRAIFVSKKDKEVTVELVDPIQAQFPDPDKRVFNENALNPTQLIQIGNNTNTTPF